MKKTSMLVFYFICFLGIQLGAQNNTLETKKKIDALIEQLSLDEKVSLCHAQSKFSSAGVPRLGIPELWMSDGPHGVRASQKSV